MGISTASGISATDGSAALGLLTSPSSVYSAGSVYSLTNTPALLTFGTTSPSLTLTKPGTYLLLVNTQLDYAAATFAAVRSATLKLRRTNNTPADLTNGSVVLKTDIITLLTYTLGQSAWWTLYSTTNSDDNIQIFGSIDVIPTAGTLNAAMASIVAIRLQT